MFNIIVDGRGPRKKSATYTAAVMMYGNQYFAHQKRMCKLRDPVWIETIAIIEGAEMAFKYGLSACTILSDCELAVTNIKKGLSKKELKKNLKGTDYLRGRLRDYYFLAKQIDITIRKVPRTEVQSAHWLLLGYRLFERMLEKNMIPPDKYDVGILSKHADAYNSNSEDVQDSQNVKDRFILADSSGIFKPVGAKYHKTDVCSFMSLDVDSLYG